MKKSNLLYLTIFVLASCRLLPSPSSTSLVSSSIPIPVDDFNPLIDGRKILKELRVISTFGQVQVSDLNPLPLSENNYPVNDTVTPYAVMDATEGQYANQVIQFNQDGIDASALLPQLAVGESLTHTQALAFLQSIVASDERFNQQTLTTYFRDLSHIYYGSPYYWFNNFLFQESMVIKRHPNLILFGEGSQTKTFQTEVNINIDVDYQLYANDSMIFEIRDETYPSGFFGASDRKFETIRTTDNFKQALTIGPVQTILNTWQQLQREQSPMPIALVTPWTNLQSSITLTKTASDTIAFSLSVQSLMDEDTPEETLTLQVVLQGNQWQPLQQTYQLWEPIV